MPAESQTMIEPGNPSTHSCLLTPAKSTLPNSRVFPDNRVVARFRRMIGFYLDQSRVGTSESQSLGVGVVAFLDSLAVVQYSTVHVFEPIIGLLGLVRAFPRLVTRDCNRRVVEPGSVRRHVCERVLQPMFVVSFWMVQAEVSASRLSSCVGAE